MPKPKDRHNAALFGWLRAGAIAALAWGGMASMQAHPWWLPPTAGVVAGLVALGNVEFGVLLALLALCVPLLAVSPIVGIIVAVVLMSAEHYLGGRGASAFLLIGLALAGAFVGPVWAAAALAGYLLGPTEGALTAAVSCLAIEATGILTAQRAIGTVVTGGSPPAIVTFAAAPPSLVRGDWLAGSFKSISPAGVNNLFAAFGRVHSPAALVVQMIVWVLAAVATGAIIRRAGKSAPLWVLVAAVTSGVAVQWLGDAVAHLGTGVPFSATGSTVTFGSSLLVAVACVAARETVFARIAAAPAAAPAPASTTAVSMATEDADVDELLRLIATAEDKLVTKHTLRRVVLITDMKSFASMTEEDGSVATAKAIQRHRDVLVPVISANHGCGKSTGGDGIVAAFESPADAIKAAVEGQRALAEHNAAHTNEREVLVRMGLASGEVVLDNGGRPFIGAGLNLAARVMNLADGGQIFASGDVASVGVGIGTTVHSFGAFELKNIASPIEIVEVLWFAGQTPKEPHAADTDAT